MNDIPYFPQSTYWAMEPQRYANMLAVAPGLLSMDITALRGEPEVMRIEGNVATINVTGAMDKTFSWFLSFFGGTSTLAVKAAVDAAASDKSVKAILMIFDSPGGGIDGLAELADSVRAARAVKPVIGQVFGMAASAAFWIAAQSTELFMQRMDTVGSIGVRMELFDFSEAFKEQGVKAIPIDTGKFKSAGMMGTEVTEEQIADFQRMVDEHFTDFLKSVAKGRNMTVAQVRKAAEGQLFFAEQAIDLGLVDKVQTLEKTAAQVQRMAGKGDRRSRAALDDDAQLLAVRVQQEFNENRRRANGCR